MTQLNENIIKSDDLYQLPKGWVWTKVSDVIDKVPLTGKKLKKSDYKEEADLPVVDQGQSFIGGYTDNEEPKINVEKPLIVFGDHTKIIKYIDFDFAAGADGVKVIKPQGMLYPKLFYYFIQAIQLPDKGYARHFQFLEKSQIPLPPFPEQHRIVEKIEELFTRLDAGIDSLKKAQAQLKRYRQSVLKAAVEGKLTEQWREAHKGELEPASVLLERILKERREKWEAEQLELFGKKGKMPGDDRWKSKYKEAGNADIIGNLPQISAGWIWTTVEQLASTEPNSITDGPFGSNLKTSHYTESGPRVVRLQNIAPMQFVNEKAHISDEHYQELKKHAVYAGDIVIASLGHPAPRACIIPPWLGDAIAKADCIRFETSAYISGPYVMYALNSPPTQKRTESTIHGIGRPRLGLGGIRRIAIPLPPYKEQIKIIDEIEKSFSVADEVEATIESELKRAERLRQSILKQAFSGRLVPQDPSDEPATVLLERIKAEKAKREKPAKRAREPKQMELF